MGEAELALFEAKASGRNRYRFHSEALEIAMLERVTMVDELRAALDRGEQVYYQPQVEVPSQKPSASKPCSDGITDSRPTHGRRLHPNRREDMDDRSDWAMGARERPARVACSGDRGIAPRVTAVNLSAAELISSSDFLSELVRGRSADHLDPGKFELQLTELLLMETRHSDGASSTGYERSGCELRSTTLAPGALPSNFADLSVSAESRSCSSS